MISAPSGAPRFAEASIGAVTRARYDGLADWYEATLLGDPLVPDTALRLLGAGPGRLLDVGCGTGFHTVRFAEAGWSVVGIDPSDDQLRLARGRGLDVMHGRGEGLQVGLDAGAPARVGGRDGETPWNCHDSLRRYEPDQVRRV